MLRLLWTCLALLEALLRQLEHPGGGMPRWGRVRRVGPDAGLYPEVSHLFVAMFCVCTGDRLLGLTMNAD